jgi:hypothetical protein
MKKIKAKLGRLGIRSIFYLDDILVLGSSYINCMANLMKALSLLIEAGLGEVQFDSDDQLHLLGDDLGLSQGDLVSPRTSWIICAVKHRCSSAAHFHLVARSWF